MFKELGIFLKKPETTDIIKRTCDFLTSHDISLSIIKHEEQKPLLGLPRKNIDELDLILSFGGDGTILQISRILGNIPTPILGINQGKIGFLTSISEKEISTDLETIVIQGKYQKQERQKIECHFNNSIFHALNDIVIKTSEIARIGNFTISHPTKETFSFPADGIIISSATGSTGYNLAAGGPILPYKSDLMVMTPICPYKYHVQSIILPRTTETFINIVKDNSPYGITVDGQQYIEFKESQQTITIKNSCQKLNLIYPEDYNFYGILQNKLNFGGSFDK